MFKVKLKPCPFCGSEAEVGLRQERDDYGNCIGSAFYAVNCKACGAEAGNREKQLSLEPKEMAIVAQEEWNTRSHKRGKWLEVRRHRDADGCTVTDYKCSECGIMLRDTNPDDRDSEFYCYHCGADMRG